MLAHDPLKKSLYDHCLGPGNPEKSLESTGVLQKAWADRYFALLEQASQAWREQPAWPREVVAAVYAASSRPSAKYDNWHRWTTGVNADTEHLIALVRAASERFLLECAAPPPEIR